MRPTFAFAICIALAATTGCSRESQTAADMTEADRRAIAQLLEEENAGFTGKDVERVLAVYAADVVMMPPNEPPIHGREALRSWFEKVFGQEGFEAESGTSDALQVAGDWAVERLTLRSIGTGEPTGKVVHVYQREADGSWKIAQDIWNSDLRSMAPEAPE